MGNGSDVTRKHMNILIGVTAGMFSILIGLIAYIWHDEKQYREERDNVLLEATMENAVSVDAIMKYVLIRDGVDLPTIIDQAQWDKLIEEFKSNPRGAIEGSYIPDEKTETQLAKFDGE